MSFLYLRLPPICSLFPAIQLITSLLETFIFHFTNFLQAVSIFLKDTHCTYSCSHSMNTTLFICILSSFITLFILLWRYSNISSGVLLPYSTYSSFIAFEKGCSTAFNSNVLMLSSTPKNFSYSMTYLAWFILPLLWLKAKLPTYSILLYPSGTSGLVHVMHHFQSQLHNSLFPTQQLESHTFSLSWLCPPSFLFCCSFHQFSSWLMLPHDSLPMTLVIGSVMSSAMMSFLAVIVVIFISIINV